MKIPQKPSKKPGNKLTEPRLAEPNSLLSSIIESPKDIIIFALDRKICYTAFNNNHKKTMKKIWGVDIELGMNMLDIIKNPDDREKAKRNFNRALKGESFTLIEKYGEPPNRFYYQDTYNPVFNSAGEVTGLSLFLIDITETKKAENELDMYHNQLENMVALRTQELEAAKKALELDIIERKQIAQRERTLTQRLSTMIDNLPGGIIIETPERKVLKVNPKFCEMFAIDVPPEALEGVNCRELITQIKSLFPDNRGYVQRIEKIITIGKNVFNEELHLTDSRVFERDYIPVEVADGIIEHLWHYRDITDHKRAEKHLLKSEERFRSLYENSTIGLYRTTPEGKVLLANPTLVQMLGYSSLKELKARNLEKEGFQPGYPRRIFKNHIDKNGYIRGFESAWKRHDGKIIYIRESAKVVRDEKGNIRFYEGTVEDITERKLAEEESRKAREVLQENEKRFRTLAESTAMGILVYSGESIIYVNKAARQLTGYSEDELLSMRFWDMVHPDFQKLIRQRGEARQRGEKVPNRYEFKIIRKDGAERWIDFTAGQINWQKKSAAIGTAFDITERKLAEEESRKAREVLQESEKKYRQLIENANEGIYIAQEGKLKFVNPMATRIMGYNNKELLSKPFADFVHPDDRELILQKYFKRIKGKKVPDNYSFRIIDKKGDIKWLSIRSVNIMWEGKPAVLNFSTNITKRILAEKALKDSEKRYQNLYHNAPDLYDNISPDGTILDINETGARLLGYSRKELIGKPLSSITAPEIHDFLSSYFTVNGKKGETIEMEIPYLRKDGKKLWCHLRSDWVRDANGNLLYSSGIARDIAQRKLAEAESRKAREVLKESEKKYRQLIENANEGIYIAQEGKLKFANPMASDIMGYDNDELLSKPFTDFIHPEDQKLVFQRYISRINGQKTPDNYAFRVIRKNGEVRWLSIRSVNVEWNGKPATLNFSTDITEQMRIEKALRESDMMNRSLLEGSPICNKIIDLDFKLQYMSTAGITSLKIPDIKPYYGQPFPSDFYPESVRPSIIEKLKTAKRGMISNIEAPIIDMEGNEIWYFTTFVPALDDNGKVAYIIASSVDVTERKMAKDALIKSEKKYKGLYNSIRDAILVADIHRNIIDCNAAFTSLFGYTLDEIKGKKTAYVYENEEEYQQLGKALKEHFRKGPFLKTVNYKKASGEVFPGETGIFYLTDDQSEMTGFIGLIRDITDRKRIEDALREKEEKYRGIFDESIAAIYLFDNQKNFIDSNQAGLDLLRYSRKELLKMKISQVDADSKAVLPAHKQLLAGDRLINYEHRLRRKDGSVITVLNNSRPITDAAGNVVGMQSTIIDVTERRAAEQKIKKSLQEKEVLLKEVHHRVKNNLQVITSLLNLQAAGFSDKHVRALFDESRDRIRSMALVHENLYQSEDYSRVDFAKYLKTLTGHLFRVYQRMAAFVTLKLDAGSIMLTIDSAIPCGIVVNELVTNALKHAFPHGRKGKISVSFQKKDSRILELIVADNGVGLPDEKELKKNTSLGMNLIAILIKDQLKGTIDIQRTGGTLVRIQFPV